MELTQDEIIRDIMEVRDRCMQRAPVVDMKGRQVQDEEGNNLWAGSSPRAWGTPWCTRALFFGLRFIPTCVGNTSINSDDDLLQPGSSPRAWGTRHERPR